MKDGWTDETLYLELRARKPQALEALIARYSREIAYFVRPLLDGVGTTQDAEECVYDLFMIAWDEIGDYDPARGTLRTWLTMRAKYLALDRRRQLQRRQALLAPALESGAPDPDGRADHDIGSRSIAAQAESMDHLLERRERHQELRCAVERLPELEQQLVHLRYFGLKSIEEIANMTGLTRRAIDSRLWRARKFLRETLEAVEERAQASAPVLRPRRKAPAR